MFVPLTIINNTVNEHPYDTILSTYCIISLGIILQSGITGLKSTHVVILKIDLGSK